MTHATKGIQKGELLFLQGRTTPEAATLLLKTCTKCKGDLKIEGGRTRKRGDLKITEPSSMRYPHCSACGTSWMTVKQICKISDLFEQAKVVP